ncbi:CP2 transcription factor-domain-containing protein [Aspergillus granulosus]|uniref:CP2 transcription factor-domain-containing protein n=1 Tax=Aspergillus granulosus TaxID=176169 RepID=A0ABR4H2X7_9EURO
MFRNRRNSQKPDEELIQRFQKTFPDVVMPTATLNDVAGALHPQFPMGHMTPSKFAMDTEMKLDPTMPAPNPQDQFMTPMVDPNSVQFINPLNQYHGYYTPNSGGLAAVYHSPAGDLHTPGMNMNAMTPLSLSQQAGVPPNGIPLDPFHPQLIPPQFQNPQPFATHAAFAPSAFVQGETSFDGVEESLDEGSLNDVDMQGSVQSQMTTANPDPDQQDPQPGESFRYHVTLRAPTAMINHQNEIPVTYLNKGQAYSMSVVDTDPLPASSQLVKYRTYVRVSFQEEEQRSKPAACWQLWKEGRGTSEAHQRGGKLQAVEYVDPIQGSTEDQKNRQVQLESSSFDGFCVTWSPNPTTGASECAISVRFNFLSTDFSHSKGVKGIPVRLCAKTEMITGESPSSDDSKEAEVCYCKVKLFRDHGAERKLSNDVAHVKKTIEKLRQQIQQNELGAGGFGKRKRSSAAVAFKGSDPRPSKLFKHKRTLSISSQDGKTSVGDDLHEKLVLLQDMFSSTRPISILGLRGDEQDDPDAYPVQLPNARDYTKKEAAGGRHLGIDRNALQEASPASSHISINSPIHPQNIMQANAFYDSEYSRQSSEVPDNKHILKHPVKVQKLPSKNGNTMGYIEAVDIDSSYRPPAERQPRPIACFYVRFPRNDQQQDDYYRAVYLTERTVRDLMEKISMKQRIDPQRIMRVLLVKENGLRIMVDDDVVRELPDGQDMVVEISEAPTFDAVMGGGADTPSPVEVKLRY